MEILASAGVAAADRVFLSSGDRLTGRLVRFEKDTLTFVSNAAGRLSINRGKLVSFETDGIVTVVFRGGNALTGRISSEAGGGMRIQGVRRGVDTSISLSEVMAIYPGDKDLSRGFRWSGRINVGASMTTGNSETESVRIDGESTGRAPQDRITVSGEFNTQSDREEEVVNNARLDLKHDHFVTEKVYFYTNAAGERDEFKDLNLRTTLGTGVGYQIFDSDERQLSVEGGPAYRNDDFEEAPDEDSAVGRWAVKFEHDLPKRIARFFHFHEGVIDLDDTSNLVLRSRTGIRVPFRQSLNVTLQLNVDYDNQPAANTEKTDKAYIFTLGYTW